MACFKTAEHSTHSRRLKGLLGTGGSGKTTSDNEQVYLPSTIEKSKISRSKSRYLCSQHDPNEQPGAQNRSFVRSGRFPHKFRAEVHEDGLSGMPARMVAVVAGVA